MNYTFPTSTKHPPIVYMWMSFGASVCDIQLDSSRVVLNECSGISCGLSIKAGPELPISFWGLLNFGRVRWFGHPCFNMLSRVSIWRIAPIIFKLQGLQMEFSQAYESAIRILEHTIGRPNREQQNRITFRLKYSAPYIQKWVISLMSIMRIGAYCGSFPTKVTKRSYTYIYISGW